MPQTEIGTSERLLEERLAALAAELSTQLLHRHEADVPQCLAQFAQARWQRNARVQNRAVRNGQIFHAAGPMRWGRDLSLRLLGSRVMDVPWLYGYQGNAASP